MDCDLRKAAYEGEGPLVHSAEFTGMPAVEARRAIVAADICLKFHDPPDAATRRIVPDESRPDECPAGVERRTGKDGPVDDGQASG